MKTTFLGLYLIFVFTNVIRAQSFPDYAERTLLFKDSTQNFPNLTITASDGIIDPDLYFIGPGDNLLISIRGVVEQINNILVNQEGYLIIPKTGIIDVKDITLSETRKKIIDFIQSIYRNVDIHVSLTSVKTIKVNIIGAVAKPSSVVLPGNSKLFDVISTSKVLDQHADLRNIRIIDRKNEVHSYDLISYLRIGDRANNPYLREGDIIQIDPSDKVVSVFGFVKYPGVYEYVENETVQHLINIAGGLTDNAREDTIEISGFMDNDYIISSKYFSLQSIQESKFTLKKGDRVIVRRKPEYRIDRYVTISGFVRYPGVYKIIKDKTKLRELLVNEAGGFLERASLPDAFIVRNTGSDDPDPEFERLKNIPRADMNDDEYDYLKARSRQKKGKMVVDFERLFINNDTTEDLILREGDEIFVPEKVNYITLVGQVLKPGNIIFKPDLSVDEYIDLAGGFGWRAVKGDIRVIKSNTGEWLDADDVDDLAPGDVIWVPEDPPSPKFWDIFQTSLTILGQVATVVAATVAVIVTVR